MRVLGIETSCDDTAAAIYDGDSGLLCHRLASQIELHRPHGGVVPELAARDHIRTLLPLVDNLIHDRANRGRTPDAVAYTAGPGLAGALLVGASLGRSLSRAWKVPAVGVHHMEGHLLAPMLEDEPPELPLLALLVSGGHTLLVDVAGPGDYRILGQSLDDAAGEAFDKTAKLLGLGYPGGPAIARAALDGDGERFTFPRPMTNRPGLDFSFSVLKTHALTTSRQQPLDPQTVCDIALAFELAVVDTLAIKCLRGLEQSGRKRLVVAGGGRRKPAAAGPHAGGRPRYRRRSVLSAPGVLYRQRRHDRLCRAFPVIPGRRRQDAGVRRQATLEPGTDRRSRRLMD